MTWIDNTIFWHAYPLGLGAAPVRENQSPGHRLRAVTERLDHVVSLGANGLILGPIFASDTHGYDTVDHFRIDSRLGTEDDFADLTDQCRQRGIRLVLDGVFSHVAAGHAALPQLQAVDRDRHPAVFEGHHSLLRLDHTKPATVDLVVDVMNFWCDRGADGWRLDAAYSVEKAFWAKVLPRVRQRHPQVWVEGEVLHGDYAGFVAESGADSVTQYELWKAIWSCLAEKNLFELDWALQRHNTFLETFVPQTFIGNHDVTRIASAVGPDNAQVAMAILMTVGGIPSIYYGDELALTGTKENRLGGDDAVRPAWPATSNPRSDAMFDAHRSLIGLRRRHPWLVNARTTSRDLTNTSAILRSTSVDATTHLDLQLDLNTEPRARVIDADGRTLWTNEPCS